MENFASKMMLCNSIKDLSKIENDKYIYEPKKDGLRAFLVHTKKNGLKLWNREHKNILENYPEIKNLKFKDDFILDGELCAKDFSTLMSRQHLSDKFKIDLLAKKNPVTFWAFDILFLNNEMVMDFELINRKKVLEVFYRYENPYLKVLPYLTDLNTAKEMYKNEEGIILKERTSKYEMNTRSDKWLKYKKRVEVLLRFDGYEQNKDNSITLIQKKGKYRVKCNDLTAIEKLKDGFIECEVEGLELTKNGMVRMPILKRLI